MAQCEEVARSEEYKRILDDHDLTSWLILCDLLTSRIVCDIEGFSKLVVNSAGEGGYDECIKHLDPAKVWLVFWIVICSASLLLLR